MARRRHDERGFSLIELTVTMAVIGLMAMIGLPSMQEWLERYRVRTAAQEVAAAMQLQRMRAVSQNDDFSIDFNVGAGTYALYQGDPSSGTLLDPLPHVLPSGVAYSGDSDPVSTPNDELLFHADGSLNDSTASDDQIFLGNSLGDVFTVTVNRATGRVQVAHHAYAY
ncbi:MAG TPA: GspH/FimT family pseudopilin [Acidobacteriota bacterium]|nr:GspH/FimT family pseudopilin [Acidobacteriota bacterium]